MTYLEQDRHLSRQMRRELTDWLQCLAGGALWVALVWGAVWLHSAVSGGSL